MLFRKYDPENPDSVRPIDGDWLEFMLSGNKGYFGFLTLVSLMNQTNHYPQIDPESFRLDMIAYAHRQMREDERTVGLEILKDEAVIISLRDYSEQQNVHLDILDPRNIQGVMMISEGKHVFPTYEYEPKDQVVLDLPTFLEVYDDFPPSITSILCRQPPLGTATERVNYLLTSYGKLLSEGMDRVSKQPAAASPLKTGSLLTLPGGVIHAGPPSRGVRAVLFDCVRLWVVDRETNPHAPSGLLQIMQYTKAGTVEGSGLVKVCNLGR